MSFNKSLALVLRDVWKKYSLREVFHRSLREDIMHFFRRNENALKKDEFWALQGITLEVEKGECVGLYGPNGVGKSTILKLIASVTYPTRGSIEIFGKVAPLIEVGAGFHPDLTGRENIFVNGTIIGMSIKEIKNKLDDIIAFSELGQFIDTPVKKYSSGMHLKLGMAVAVHSGADILLVDEILSVGDESFRKKCIDALHDLLQQGKTIILVSHDKFLLEQLAHRIAYIDRGKIVKEQEIKGFDYDRRSNLCGSPYI
ncbi:MAG: ABC transporter ATP-binding protein [Thermodesulforhabdaceae bacterium]